MPFKRLEITRPRGINKDLSPYELPNDKWTGGIDVNFSNFRTNRSLGYSQVFPNLDIQPLFAMPLEVGSPVYWYYADETSIYRTEGTTQTDITRTAGAYTGTFKKGWTGNIFNGVVIMNNNTDAPQFYDTATSKMLDLTGWPTDYKTNSIRPFKNFLIALNITDDSGENFPQLVRWSDAASTGQVPSNWNSTDPASQAGTNPLADTGGIIYDGLTLGNSFMIYKSDSVWAMQFIGGANVFSFRKVFSDNGIMGLDCVTEFDGNHFVVGVDDVYVHNGTTKRSVISNKYKREFFTQINEDYIERVKCVKNNKEAEIWVYFPSTDSSDGTCDKALVWDWEVDEWSIRSLGGVTFITEGILDPQESDSWDDDTSSWDADTTSWGEGSFNPTERDLLICGYSDSKFYRANSDVLLGGDIVFTTRVERKGLDFGDNLNYKFISRVVPHFIGEGTVNLYIGTESRQGEGVRWSSPVTFTIDEDYKADFRESGRYIAFKIESDSSTQWNLTGYTLEYTESGER